jgi:hypothetical protein
MKRAITFTALIALATLETSLHAQPRFTFHCRVICDRV